MIVKAISIVQHVIQIRNGVMINVSVSVKKIVCTKEIIFGILAHVFLRKVGI